MLSKGGCWAVMRMRVRPRNVRRAEPFAQINKSPAN